MKNSGMNRKSHPSRQAESGKSFSARALLRRLLGLSVGSEDSIRGRLLLEPLESRQMMAGDVEWLFTAGSDAGVASGGAEAAHFTAGRLAAEGEAAPDLVAFATALKDAGVSIFTAAWCRFCTDQKNLFEDGKEELPSIEVTNPDRTLNAIGVAEGIESFPTWEFPDGSRATGVLTLQQISERSGVAIPTSSQPRFAPIGNLTLEVGSPLHVPVDAYDPNGGPLTVTVTVANPNLLTATVLPNNRSAKMTVRGWGDMVFELFEDRAPRAAGRFIELAQAGFYDRTETEQIIFHRVIDNFVLQAGDPTGTGSGGSDLGDFDDQFHVDLQHNRTGVLSYAKSLDDTNDSQFFITEGAQRHLDFNHSIFGQLVEGDAVREAISETAVSGSSSAQPNRPVNPVIIEKVEIFQDNENSVVMLKAAGSTTGQTDVTFTVTDGSGNTFSEVVRVTVVGDANNGAPFLADINPVVTAANVPAVFQLQGIDAENNALVYEARIIDSSGATAAVDQATGTVTVTPANNYSGQILTEVAVRSTTTPTSTSPQTRSQTMDLQVVPVTVGPLAPLSIALSAASDTGLSNSDGITNTAPLTFTVTGVTPGATVNVLSGDTQIGVGVAFSTTATITTNNVAALGNQTHVISARQVVGGIASAKSPTINVIYDTVPPVAAGAIASQATAGVLYSANIQHPEEGSGLRYSIVSGPAGLTIDAVTGVVSWTPTVAQAGDQAFSVRLTDAAGNAREQTYSVAVVAEPLVRVRLETTDLQGTAKSNFAPGEQFLVRVFGRDERLFGGALGIYSLYLDLDFDPALVVPSPFTPAPSESNPNPQPTVFEYSTLYSSVIAGTVGTGIIDEAGATSAQLTSVGPGEKLIFSVRMRAVAPGSATISSNPAEGGGRDVLLYDRDSEVPSNRVIYGQAALNISSTFTAANDSTTVNEDSSQTAISVLANDTIQVPGTTLTLVSVQSPTAQGGTVTISGATARYTPASNFSGTDTFTYVVRDQNSNQQTATVTVTVTGVNDPPVAQNDSFTVVSGSTENVLNVLANDSSLPDTGETLRVTQVGASSRGATIVIGSNGANVRYTPPASFVGTDTFTYTLSDGSLTSTGTVTVTVGPANNPPTAVNDSFTILEDAVAADFNVLANDSNSDADETFALFSVAPAANGTASISSDGTKLRYQPAANFSGVDRVTYVIRDSNGGQATATATFTVQAVNDPPPAPARTASVLKGSTSTVVLDVAALAALNVDGQSESLTIVSTGTPTAGGSVSISSDGKTLRYTPVSSFVGNDSLTYTIRDGGQLTATGTLTVEVLDYVPRDVVVQFAGESFTSFGPGMSGLLSGSDYLDRAVSRSSNYFAASAGMSFDDLPPGEYQVRIPSLPFVIGAQQEQILPVRSEPDDVNGQSLSVSYGRLQSAYLSVRDFLGNTPKRMGFVVIEPGKAHAWGMLSSDTGMPGNPVVSLSADGTQLTLEVDDPSSTSGGRRRAVMAVTDPRVESRGSEAGYRLFRINMDPTGLTFTPVVAPQSLPAGGNTPQGSGEGEGVGELKSAPASAAPAAVAPAAVAPAFVKQPEQSEVASGSRSAVIAPRVGEGEGGPLREFEVAKVVSAGVPSAEVPAVLQKSTSSATQLAVDTAMNEMLPKMELRSGAGEYLAEHGSEDATEAIDAAFDELGGLGSK